MVDMRVGAEIWIVWERWFLLSPFFSKLCSYMVGQDFQNLFEKLVWNWERRLRMCYWLCLWGRIIDGNKHPLKGSWRVRGRDVPIYHPQEMYWFKGQNISERWPPADDPAAAHIAHWPLEEVQQAGRTKQEPTSALQRYVWIGWLVFSFVLFWWFFERMVKFWFWSEEVGHDKLSHMNKAVVVFLKLGSQHRRKCVFIQDVFVHM